MVNLNIGKQLLNDCTDKFLSVIEIAYYMDINLIFPGVF